MKETKKMKRSPKELGTIQRGGEANSPKHLALEFLRERQEDTLHPQNANWRALEVKIRN